MSVCARYCRTSVAGNPRAAKRLRSSMRCSKPTWRVTDSSCSSWSGRSYETVFIPRCQGVRGKREGGSGHRGKLAHLAQVVDGGVAVGGHERDPESESELRPPAPLQ